VKRYHPADSDSRGDSFGSRTPVLQAAGRHQGISYGGVPVIVNMLDRLGFAEAINDALPILKVRRGYAESDHVLNVALNALSDGRTLEDIDLRRTDPVFLKAIGAQALPDPTTAGDFCRRFDVDGVFALQEACNEIRKRVWSKQPSHFLDVARLDADGVFVATGAECAQGIDWSGHKRDWGYHPLIVSLASTQEPLYIVNRSGARPSHEGAAQVFDRAISLCLGAGFKSALLRGDTDFSQTRFLDGWDDKDNVKSGVHALRAPLKCLVSNWAYMVMTSLAWSFKAWFALLMPISEETSGSDRSVAKKVLAMEFRTFVGRLMRLPVMVIESGRRLVLRLLCTTAWTPHLLRTALHFRE
jgi:Transposase DDE domain group 1